eukprot:gnl/TRDRNA2_/TRDRNA2_163658_c0_seq1.p1 gnl/TRDRNA2_/TRDRNA2_163658_c0~~gnl/TRDRNA2_/TRDRNA2_163658_c0_seq1.p1  ORF type:complete len:140 (-),score=22.89 gnl/TRDRNA2_/TRDRNA2_163658_c0_seq1:15-434(-)
MLILGVGGGIIASFLERLCPGIDIVSVDRSPTVVAAARDFFAFNGNVMVKDKSVALSDLAGKGKHFDIIISDVEVPLDENDMRNVCSLLKQDGTLIENLTRKSLVSGQLKLFNVFFDQVTNEALSRGNTLVFGKNGKSV